MTKSFLFATVSALVFSAHAYSVHAASTITPPPTPPAPPPITFPPVFDTTPPPGSTPPPDTTSGVPPEDAGYMIGVMPNHNAQPLPNGPGWVTTTAPLGQGYMALNPPRTGTGGTNPPPTLAPPTQPGSGSTAPISGTQPTGGIGAVGGLGAVGGTTTPPPPTTSGR